MQTLNVFQLPHFRKIHLSNLYNTVFTTVYGHISVMFVTEDVFAVWTHTEGRSQSWNLVQIDIWVIV